MKTKNMNSKSLALFGSTSLIALLLVGCGGSSGSAAGGTGSRGTLSFTVQWPDTRLVPNAANAVRLRVFPEGANVNTDPAVGVRFVDRVSGTSTPVTVSDIVEGTYIVVADSFTGRTLNGPGDLDDVPTGNALSVGQGQVTINPGANTNFGVTMDPSLAQMQVTVNGGANTSLPATGEIVNIATTVAPELVVVTASPRNAANNLVLLPTTTGNIEFRFAGIGSMELLSQSSNTGTGVITAVLAAKTTGSSGGFQIKYFDGGNAGTAPIQATFAASFNVQQLTVGSPVTLTPANTTGLLDVDIDDIGTDDGRILALGDNVTPNQANVLEGVIIGVSTNTLAAPVAVAGTSQFATAAGRISQNYLLNGAVIQRISDGQEAALANGLDVSQEDNVPPANVAQPFFLTGSGNARSISTSPTNSVAALTNFALAGNLNNFNTLAVGTIRDSAGAANLALYVASGTAIRQYFGLGASAGSEVQLSDLNNVTATTTFQTVAGAVNTGTISDIASIGSLVFVLSNAQEKITVLNARGSKVQEIPLPPKPGGVDYTRIGAGFGGNGRAIIVLRDDNSAIRLPISVN